MEPGEFEGRIARYHWDAEPRWPEAARAADSAPNVVVVVLDDVGYAQLGGYGSDIATPHLDALAAGGAQYSNFHTTSMCSPTRACVLTGRNHHTAGMGRIIQLATGFPGYDARIPRSVAMLPEVLTMHGYAAWAVGKWHLTPEDECHLGASRERWPLSRGFERFYGFFDGETHQGAPALVHDSHQVLPPRSVEEGYHLTEDLVDRCIEFHRDLRHVDVDKPFFLYLSTGACHSPHQAPREWIERYRGSFDQGWDVWREQALARQIERGLVPPGTLLSPRPDWVPAWESLSDRERAVFARYMEAFAGFLSHTDHHIGRLLAHIASTGEADDTMVIVLSDNGASSEGGPIGSLNDVRSWNVVPQSVDEAWHRLDEIGGPRVHANYPWGWAVAGNTPFRRWKREVHEGGIADPLVVSWPRRLRQSDPGPGGPGVRHQYVHAIDIVPTVLEAAGIDMPTEVRGVAQRPLEGLSFLPTLDRADGPDLHTTQYYEMLGCRAIYHDGWKAVAYHPIQDDEPGLDRVRWELYDVRNDPTECDDRAGSEPERLRDMVDLWWSEAERHQVLPIDNRPFSDMVLSRPPTVRPRRRYVYHPHSAMVPEAVAVNVKNRSHVVRAVVTVPADGPATGTILSQGSVLGGWILYLDSHGRPTYVHNLSGRENTRVAGSEAVPAGSHEIEMRYGRSPDAPRLVELLVDGALVGSGEVPSFTWIRFSLTGAGLCCGWTASPAVTDDVSAPARFTGGLSPVVVEVDGDAVVDPLAEALGAVTSQ